VALGIHLLTSSGRLKRRMILTSVNKHMSRHFYDIGTGKSKQRVTAKIMQDIAIWYANEVLEGRAKLE
jgi:hypothetical protein